MKKYTKNAAKLRKNMITWYKNFNFLWLNLVKQPFGVSDLKFFACEVNFFRFLFKYSNLLHYLCTGF